MKTKNLDRVLSKHNDYCSIHVFSDGDNRHCSCGRDRAIVESDILKDALRWIFKAHQYFEDHETISKNSQAGQEMEDIIQRAKNEKIIGKKDS